MPWPTRAQAPTALLPCLLSILLLTGCAGLRPYSEVRHQQAKAAQAAWQAVDLQALVATERRNLDQLLAAELAAQDQLATSIRDHRLRHVLSATPLQETLLGPIDADLRRLVGDPVVLPIRGCQRITHFVDHAGRKCSSGAQPLPASRKGSTAPAGRAIPASAGIPLHGGL